MKTKTTVILLLIAAALCAYVFLIEPKLPTVDDIEKAKKRIFDCKAADISRIEIDAPNASQMTVGGVTPTRVAIILNKSADGKWELQQPVQAKAEQTFIESVATQLTDLIKNGTIEAKDIKDMANYGLKEPTMAVTFTVKSKVETVMLGKEAPMEMGIYVAVAGNKNVYIIPRYFADLINKPIFEYRYKKIFDTNVTDAANFKLIHPDKTIELVKKENDWYLAQPVTEKAEQTKVREVLSAIGTVTVASFISDKETNIAKYGLENPSLKVVVIDPKNPAVSETLLIGTEWGKEGRVAFKEGTTTIFTVGKTTFDQLGLGLDLLRDKKYFHLENMALSRLQMNYNNKPVLTIEKNMDKKWQFIYPAISATGAVPYDLESFIDKLNNALIEQYITDSVTDLKAYGLNEDFKDIELITTGGSPTVTSRILLSPGRMESKSPYTYVKSADNPKVVALSASIFEYLKQGSIHLRKKALIDISFDKIKKVTLSGEAITTSMTCEQFTPQEWNYLPEPAAGQAGLPDAQAGITATNVALGKNENLNNLAVELSHLTVLEFVADTGCLDNDLSEYGLDKPSFIIKIDIADKDGKISVRTLLIGKKPDTHYYARFEDDVAIFKVNASVVEPIAKLAEELKGK